MRVHCVCSRHLAYFRWTSQRHRSRISTPMLMSLRCTQHKPNIGSNPMKSHPPHIWLAYLYWPRKHRMIRLVLCLDHTLRMQTFPMQHPVMGKAMNVCIPAKYLKCYLKAICTSVVLMHKAYLIRAMEALAKRYATHSVLALKQSIALSQELRRIRLFLRQSRYSQRRLALPIYPRYKQKRIYQPSVPLSCRAHPGTIVVALSHRDFVG